MDSYTSDPGERLSDLLLDLCLCEDFPVDSYVFDVSLVGSYLSDLVDDRL